MCRFLACCTLTGTQFRKEQVAGLWQGRVRFPERFLSHSAPFFVAAQQEYASALLGSVE
jgi:hypothetical protein